MADAIDRLPFLNGHFGCKDPNGEPVIDSLFLNSKFEKVSKNGSFYEMNNEFPQQPRANFLRLQTADVVPPGTDGQHVTAGQIKAMKIADLKTLAASREVPIDGLLKPAILKAILESRSAEEIKDDLKLRVKADSTNKDHNVRSLKQSVTTDFEKLHELYGDCAYTAMKFFLANQGLGDYHFNFVTETHFKNMSVYVHMWPTFCEQVQDAIDNGQIVGWAPFYDRDKKVPTRQLKIYKDRAPYHLGVMVQLNSCTKTEIAEILRLKMITTIVVKVKTTAPSGDITFSEKNFEVPEEGYDWERGNPTS
jgi:hypothetical protein